MPMTLITGYVTANRDGIIYGTGATADAAYADMRRYMAQAGVKILADNEDDDAGAPGAWTRASDFKTWPATATLLSLVESHGGNCAWRDVGGIACTVAEAEA
jgi:hypothetical protein